MTEIQNGKLAYTSKPQFNKAATKTFGVERGGLTGSTDTDYFYFLCPKCGEVLQHNVLELWEYPPPYPNTKQSPCQHIVLEAWCQKCSSRYKFKVSNLGWQGGKLKNSPALKKTG